MRAINTTTLQFEEIEHQTSVYAVLSHRWGKDEISYQDYLEGRNRDTDGYRKIVNFCKLAKEHAIELAWVDTCCIDKKSSAELSEAINSMFKWYKNSRTCYVYLADIPPASEANYQTRHTRFKKSEWWQRGWTLQELLAPRHLEFYDSSWTRFGARHELLKTVESISGIESKYLLGDRHEYRRASIATRMSWASGRSTARIEDKAYCLLGLFDVNMPLLYGEGRKAFVRLQLEIIEKSDDESIFAWEGAHHVGMLAASTDYFENSKGIWNTRPRESRFERRPYSMTNKGMKFRLPSTEVKGRYRFVLLHCCAAECEACLFSKPGDQAHQWLAIELVELEKGLWYRKSKDLLRMDPNEFAVNSKAIFVHQGGR